MRAVLVVMFLGGVATADVRPDDAVIEVSAEYQHSPIHFENENGAVIANALHFEDRNGLFARSVVRFLSPPPPVATPGRYEIKDVVTRQHTYYGIYGNITTTYYKTEVRERTDEEIQQIVDASIRARREALSFVNYHTEVWVYTQTAEGANARGGAFNMRGTFYGNDRFSIEVGFGYGQLRTDVCRDDDLVKCKYRFWGVPLRVNVSFGRVGSMELAYDYNFDRVGDSGPYGTAWDPIRLALTLNPIDRLFVRARVFASPNEITSPGYGLAVGGRL